MGKTWGEMVNVEKLGGGGYWKMAWKLQKKNRNAIFPHFPPFSSRPNGGKWELHTHPMTSPNKKCIWGFLAQEFPISSIKPQKNPYLSPSPPPFSLICHVLKIRFRSGPGTGYSGPCCVLDKRGGRTCRRASHRGTCVQNMTPSISHSSSS